MGAVLRAVDGDIRREVAVKYLLDQGDSRKKARFVEEAQITGQLEHPNIVPIHELGIDAHKRLFFSMKMVHGRSLQQVLSELRDYPHTAEREYTLGRLLTIFINVCHALAYAHSRGVVHRDLKPANIMVGDFGEVYVMDWGLAKVLTHGAAGDKTATVIQAGPSFAWADGGGGDSSSATVHTSREAEDDQTVEGTILGTPMYMPPEQAHGDIAAIDRRSDIYSLGAILYEMLTLEPPIDRKGGHLAILLRVGQGEILAPEQRNPQRARAGKVPTELAAVAMKALALKPEDRYQTVEALRGDIERFLEGRSVSAKEDTKWESIRKLARRNRGVVAATAAAAVLLLAVLIGSSVVNYKARLRAEAAYSAYLKEQEDKRAQTRKSVPAFVEAAHLAADRRKFDDALAQVNAALDYDPDHAGAHLLKGQLLMARKDFAAARPALERYVKLRPEDAEARKLSQLAGAARADDPALDAEIAERLLRQHLPTLAEGLLKAPEKLLEVHRRKIESAWPGLRERLAMDADGKLSLNLAACPQVLALTPLRGMPLRTLLLHNSKVRDLTALKGMPLTHLDLYGCRQITDLTPLKGMKLTYLRLSLCGPIADYTPLKGMPLTTLHLPWTAQNQELKLLRRLPLTEVAITDGDAVSDLAPLLGLKLTSLSIHSCNLLKDLEPLRGMPLTSLTLSNCLALTDLEPLRGMPLTTLYLQQAPQLRDLTPLAGARLTQLVLYGGAQVTDLTALHGMPLTSLNLHSCTQVKDLTPLQGMPLTQLDLGGCGQVADLSPLRGMRLTSLDASYCDRITDWTPLQGMPLTSLGFIGCEQIKDLTPFQGLPLISLNLQSCRSIKDLSPVRNMPLTQLRIGECDQIADLTPLDGMKLTYVYFSPKSVKKGVDVLRRMKGLTHLNDLPAAAFWKKYDAGEFRK